MSTINVVRFFTYPTMTLKPGQLQQLVNLAYLTTRDRKLYPKEILIRYDTETLIPSDVDIESDTYVVVEEKDGKRPKGKGTKKGRK
ncbi:hypothetical protein QQX98_011886 [Neonectria punicea]|uniref:Uncharacterized protein n=1 Tax=Neonectria punicea TaxID=979145 RepID=A0ABR1GKD0_9HYPO